MTRRRPLCREAGSDPKVQLAQLAKSKRSRLVEMLTSYCIPVTGHEGYPKVCSPTTWLSQRHFPFIVNSSNVESMSVCQMVTVPQHCHQRQHQKRTRLGLRRHIGLHLHLLCCSEPCQGSASKARGSRSLPLRCTSFVCCVPQLITCI